MAAAVVLSALFYIALVRAIPPRLGPIAPAAVRWRVASLIQIAAGFLVPATAFAVWGSHPTPFFPGRPFDPPITWQWGLWKGAVLAPVVLVIAWRSLTGWSALLRVRGLWRWLGPVPQVVLPVIGFTALPWAILNGGFVVGLPTYALSPLMVVVGIGTAVWSAAIPEEVFFRMVLQSRLEPAWGVAWAVSVQALLFGAVHMPEFVWMNHLDLVSAAGQVGILEVLPGVLYGYMWYRYRNIWANIAAHAAFDSAFVLALLAGMFR